MIFYSFKPVDTLYFRGAESAEMGADHHASTLFPPPPQTIAGAIRTEYLKQHGIDFKKYLKGDVEQKIIDEIGEAGSDAPFSIIGPFFKKEEKFYIPAPYSWYTCSNSVGKVTKYKIIKAFPIKSPLFVSPQEANWAKGENIETIGGKWILLDDIDKDETENIFPLTHFANIENHTGIALDRRKKTTREGHLYSFRHFRLLEDVELVFGIDKEISLEEKGVLKLGAEQRFGSYRKISFTLKSRKISNLFMSLSIIKGSEEANSSIFATGKIRYIGGWDMVKGFHKPLNGYFPAGTVFNKKLNNNFIEI
ncbi:MAG: hypothetical protein LDL13_06120 [Calditerrivibrio sp.]|nr:hypothetical protein [Calditerrivibrio sp.]MCA1980398.1 hypothetical protein [Calditerrivibrio sp.]